MCVQTKEVVSRLFVVGKTTDWNRKEFRSRKLSDPEIVTEALLFSSSYHNT